MRIGSIPSKACPDARQIGRPSALQQVQQAAAQRAHALSRRLATVDALPDPRPYILWTGDGRVRRYSTVEAAMAAGIVEDIAHIGRSVGERWDRTGLIRDGIGWRSVSLADRADFDEFLGLDAASRG